MSASSSPVPPIPDDLKPDSADDAQATDEPAAEQDEPVADEAINEPQASPTIEGELEG